MARLTKTQWEEIKKKFIRGYVEKGKHKYYTFDELSKSNNVAKSVIHKRCKKEKWDIDKEIFANKIENKVRQKTIKDDNKENKENDQIKETEKIIELASSEIAEYDKNTFKICKTTQQIITQRLNEIIQKIKSGNIEHNENIEYKIERLSNTLMKLQETKNKCIGESISNGIIINIGKEFDGV